MDLLFSKYASPYLLLDQVIEEKRFCEFIVEFAEAKRENELIDVWLHKINDKSYVDFKDALIKPKQKQFSKQSLEATIKNSRNILNGFIPS